VDAGHMKAYLVLGCNGHMDQDGFLSCSGVDNPILDLSNIPKDERDKAVKFLNDVCGLFDGPVYEHNKAINIVDMFYRDMGLISEDILFKIQNFTRMHKICGMYLILIMKEDYNVSGRKRRLE
jgi:hypothetical protein